MLLIAVAWLYVVGMLAIVEASSPQGTLLGAFFTLLGYGILPLGLIAYLFFSPARRRRRRDPADAPTSATSSGARLDPDQGGHAAGDPVAPIGKEP